MELDFQEKTATPPADKKKQQRTSRREKIVGVAYDTQGLSDYQRHLLVRFAYFMVGNSKITPKSFEMLIKDFMELVPDWSKNKQLEYCVENGTRNLVPSWFREPSSGVTAVDNMKGQHSQADEHEIDFSEGF